MGKKPSKIAKNLEKLDTDNLVDLKVILNAKHRHDKSQKPSHCSSSNIADDFQPIFSSLHGHPLIMSVIAHNGDKPPARL